MVFLDYQLELAEVVRLTELDISSASHTTLDNHLFCGDVYFRINGVSFDAPWGWIPVISFSMQLCEIVCTIREGEVGRLEFTESDDEIRFVKNKDVMNVSCDYSKAHAQVSLSEMRDAGLMFATRIFDELSARWPLLKTNKAFQEKVDHLRRVLRHAGTTLLNDDH